MNDPLREQLAELAEALNQDAPDVADLPFSLTPEAAERRAVERSLPWDREDYYAEEADRDRRSGGR